MEEVGSVEGDLALCSSCAPGKKAIQKLRAYHPTGHQEMSFLPQVWPTQQALETQPDL